MYLGTRQIQLPREGHLPLESILRCFTLSLTVSLGRLHYFCIFIDEYGPYRTLLISSFGN
jgi:hypothetical protein